MVKTMSKDNRMKICSLFDFCKHKKAETSVKDEKAKTSVKDEIEAAKQRQKEMLRLEKARLDAIEAEVNEEIKIAETKTAEAIDRARKYAPLTLELLNCTFEKLENDFRETESALYTLVLISDMKRRWLEYHQDSGIFHVRGESKHGHYAAVPLFQDYNIALVEFFELPDRKAFQCIHPGNDVVDNFIDNAISKLARDVAALKMALEQKVIPTGSIDCDKLEPLEVTSIMLAYQTL